MRLNEVAFKQFFDNRQDIVKWLHPMINRRDYDIRDDLSVSVDGDLSIKGNNISQLPVNFHAVTGSFYVSGLGLTTMKGCPRIVGGTFNASHNKIRTLEYAPHYVGQSMLMHANKNFNCHNAHQHLKWIDNAITLDLGSTHLLGLLLVKHLPHIEIETNSDRGVTRQKRKKLSAILNGNVNDIHKVQELLIDSGFVEEARI